MTSGLLAAKHATPWAEATRNWDGRYLLCHNEERFFPIPSCDLPSHYGTKSGSLLLPQSEDRATRHNTCRPPERYDNLCVCSSLQLRLTANRADAYFAPRMPECTASHPPSTTLGETVLLHHAPCLAHTATAGTNGRPRRAFNI